MIVNVACQKSTFFICKLATPIPTLSYLLGNGLLYPMLIAALFLSRREAHRKKLIKAMQGAWMEFKLKSSNSENGAPSHCAFIRLPYSVMSKLQRYFGTIVGFNFKQSCLPSSYITTFYISDHSIFDSGIDFKWDNENTRWTPVLVLVLKIFPASQTACARLFLVLDILLFTLICGVEYIVF